MAPSGLMTVRANLWWTFILCVVLIVLWHFLSIGTRPWNKHYPPGPRALPIIGNLHQIPKKDIHLQYQKWAKQYGPIFSLKLGQQTMIVLASGGMIKKTIDKRSANYADRPQLYVRDLFEDTHVVTRGYDDTWRLDRRLYHANLNSNVVQRYAPYQSIETLQLCVDLLEDPEHFFEHIRRTTTSVSASLAYGFRIGSNESPVMARMFKSNAVFFKLIRDSKFLDWYPGLRPLFRYLPMRLRPFATEAATLLYEEKHHFAQLYREAISTQNGRAAMPSFAADIAASQKSWKGTANGDLLTDQVAAYTAGIAFEAGVDTTKNTLIAFVEAMALFPDVQIEAQKELDTIVDAGGLPTVDDISKLPYLRGIVKECLRWLPTAVSGALPHAAINADQIDGFDIPAGASVLLAIWTVNNDPELFPDPRRFEPKRHNVNLKAGEASQAIGIQDRDHWSFGAGRRICPGMHLAENTLSLAIARILWAFDIRKAKDERGNEIDIDPYAVTQSVLVCPLPFKCRITPRSSQRADLLKQEWAETKANLDANGNYKQSPL